MDWDAHESQVLPRRGGSTFHAGAPVGVGTLDADVGQLSDADLVDGVVRHSHAALAEIFGRYGDEMNRLAQRLRGHALADDVIQDVLLHLWNRPELFDPARGSLRWFLMMQTRARAIDLLRSDTARRARETVCTTAEDRSISLAVDEHALNRLAGDHAWRLLSALSEGERSAIVLAYFGDHSYREVALLLGQPEGTIKSRIRSGLTRLRHMMVVNEAQSSPSVLR